MVEWLAACLPPFFGIYLHHRCVMRGLEVGISKMFGNFEPVNFLRGGMVQPAIFCTSRVCRFDFFFYTKDMLVIFGYFDYSNRFIESIAGKN